MVFNYEGREFDTDKPIYMLGYTICNNWFPVEMKRKTKYSYPLSCKRMFIQSISFSRDYNRDGVKEGHNWIRNIEFESNLFYTPDTKNGAIIGRSTKECMKLFYEREGGIFDEKAKSRV